MRCTAFTRSGKQCRNKALAGSKCCRVHDAVCHSTPSPTLTTPTPVYVPTPSTPTPVYAPTPSPLAASPTESEAWALPSTPEDEAEPAWLADLMGPESPKETKYEKAIHKIGGDIHSGMKAAYEQLPVEPEDGQWLGERYDPYASAGADPASGFVALDASFNKGWTNGAVSKAYKKYPFACDRPMKEASCRGDVPVMMWPMGDGPSSVYTERSFDTPRFDACCVDEEEVPKVIPWVDGTEASTPMMDELFRASKDQARKFHEEMLFAVQKVTLLWEQNQGYVIQLSDKSKYDAEAAYANVLQIWYIIQNDLYTVDITADYTESVVYGTASVIRGTMPSLPGGTTSGGSVLDYMKAEFWYHVAEFVDVMNQLVSGKGSSKIQRRRRTKKRSDHWITWATRGWGAPIAAYVQKATIIQTMIGAYLVFELSGVGISQFLTDLFSPTSGDNEKRALFMAMTMGAIAELVDKRNDNESMAEGMKSFESIITGARETSVAFAKIEAKAVKTTAKAGAGAAAMAGLPMLGAITGGLGEAYGIVNAFNDELQAINFLTGNTAFKMAMHWGVKSLQMVKKWDAEFAGGWHFLELIHRSGWIGGMAYGLNKLLTSIFGASTSAAIASWLNSWFGANKSLPEKLMIALFGEVDKTTGEIRKQGLFTRKDLGKDFDEFLEWAGKSLPQIIGIFLLMMVVGQLWDRDIGGTLAEQSNEWADRRVAGFFKMNRSFLPEVNPRVFSQYCQRRDVKPEECMKKLKTVQKNRKDIANGCKHFKKEFAKRGHSVCADE